MAIFHIGMRLSVLALIVGLGLIFAGCGAFGVAMKTKDKPTSITAAELSVSGPPKDNAYVHVTDYNVNSEYIKMTREHSDPTAPWSGVWLQIHPVGKTLIRGGKPLILKDDNIHSESDLADFIKYSAFDAIVSNVTETDSDVPTTPEGMHFPTINAKEDLILEMKARPDFVYATGLTLLGVVCCVGGVFPIYLKGRKMRAAQGGNTGFTSRKL